jgi:hypothetical protein
MDEDTSFIEKDELTQVLDDLLVAVIFSRFTIREIGSVYEGKADCCWEPVRRVLRLRRICNSDGKQGDKCYRDLHRRELLARWKRVFWT